MRLLFLFSLFQAVYLLDVYIRPHIPTKLCTYSGGTSNCDGSMLNPHDNLVIAFKSGIASSTSGSTINFYLLASGPIILSSSSNDSSSISPFADFDGFFIKKYY